MLKKAGRFSHSKAGRLKLLRGVAKDFVVDDFLTFSVKAWEFDSGRILTTIADHFDATLLIIRSSAKGEDEYGGRFAGMLRSESGIMSTDGMSLRTAINNVVHSFAKEGRRIRLSDQIIVQRFITSVRACGVLLTWDLQDRAYYVINYESGTGTTNQVTSGQRGETLRILRGLEIHKVPACWRKLLSAIVQIECLFPNEVLDVEFAFDEQGVLHIFQVRGLSRICAKDQWRRTRSTRRVLDKLRRQVKKLVTPSPCSGLPPTVLSDMADWNPAEMLGPTPPLLSRSLYRFLVTTSAWNSGRVSLGYTDVQPQELMVCLGGKPYIDTRVSLNSLTPQSVPLWLRKRLVSYGIDKLTRHPELHDKIEFEIAFSCLDFRIEERLQELQNAKFSATEVNLLRDRLRMFTIRLLTSADRIIEDDMARMRDMKCRQIQRSASSTNFADNLSSARSLLNECRDAAIPCFSRLARLAFVGLAFLKSLRAKNIVSASSYDSFFSSLHTIANDVHEACIRVSEERTELKSFLSEFGHLRPMTYDINSLRYDQMPMHFWLNRKRRGPYQTKRSEHIDPQTLSCIDSALRDQGIEISAQKLFAIIKSSIEAREYAKFVFTRLVSDALEHIASCGHALKLDRDEMAHMPVEELLRAAEKKNLNISELARRWRTLIQRNKKLGEMEAPTVLPPSIVNPSDLLVVRFPLTHPNFVTSHRVEGNVISAHLSKLNVRSLEDSIVLLESADPGYDWIFAHRPKGIVTKYGGAGSHMTIRCAAFDVPAAIGCGEELFERLKKAHAVLLDCQTGVVTELI